MGIVWVVWVVYGRHAKRILDSRINMMNMPPEQPMKEQFSPLKTVGMLVLLPPIGTHRKL